MKLSVLIRVRYVANRKPDRNADVLTCPFAGEIFIKRFHVCTVVAELIFQKFRKVFHIIAITNMLSSTVSKVFYLKTPKRPKLNYKAAL